MLGIACPEVLDTVPKSENNFAMTPVKEISPE